MHRNNTKSDLLDGHTTALPVTVNLTQALLAELGATEHNLDDLIHGLIEDGLQARRQESAMAVTVQEIGQDLKRLLEGQKQQDQTLQRLEDCCGLVAASLSCILETDILLTALSAVSQSLPERTSDIDLLLKEINSKRVRFH